MLTVRDIEASCAFYHTVLGFEIRRFGDQRTALHFGNQKINLHQAGAEFEPKAARPTPGAADMCFVSLTPLDQVAAHLLCRHIPIEAGPVRRTGALGPVTSLYFRDPDGNLLELCHYDETRPGLSAAPRASGHGPNTTPAVKVQAPRCYDCTETMPP